MAPNYDEGKIYRLICADGHFYIGSTVMTLASRFNGHKQSAKRETSRVYNHCNLIGWDNVRIQLLEDYPCESRKELTAREDYHIRQNKDDPNCLNCIRAHVTHEERKELMKEYYQEHREEIIASHREYVETNRDVVMERRAKYRQENAEELRAKAREYANAHPEWKKESRRKHYEENKELVKGQIKAYYEANKDAIKAYKSEWGRKKYAEKAEERAKVSAEKAKARKDKKEARLAHEHETIQCECGGQYQRFHKNRHMASKKHQKYMGGVGEPLPAGSTNEIVQPPVSEII
jgi:hypothetical protein